MVEPSEFVFNDQARTKLWEGIQKLTKVVASHFVRKTIDHSYFGEGKSAPTTCDLLRQVHADDPFVEAGIELGRDLAHKVYKKQGDGVTTTLLCMHALMERGMQHIRHLHSFIRFRHGIEKALKVSMQALEKQAIPINNAADMRFLRHKLSKELDLPKEYHATIEKIADRGIFILEQGNELTDRLEYSSTMSIGVQVASELFYSQNSLKHIEKEYCEQSFCSFDHALIAVIESKLESIQELLPLLVWVQKEEKPLILLAEDFSEDVISTLVLNHIKGRVKVCALKLSASNDHSWKTSLEEHAHLAVLKAHQLSDFRQVIDSLGFAKKALVRNGRLFVLTPFSQKFKTINVQSLFTSSHNKDQASIAVHILLKDETDPVKRTQRHVAMQKLFAFIESAREKGIVLGGGVSLQATIAEVEKLDLEADEKRGADCVCAALAAPLKQIVQSSGLNTQTTWKKLQRVGDGFGVDLRAGKVIPLAKESIFDPLSVISTAVQDGVAHAALLLTSEAIIAKGE